jgi:hypothetical protein
MAKHTKIKKEVIETPTETLQPTQTDEDVMVSVMGTGLGNLKEGVSYTFPLLAANHLISKGFARLN